MTDTEILLWRKLARTRDDETLEESLRRWREEHDDLRTFKMKYYQLARLLQTIEEEFHEITEG